jgi:hypothetical protein
LSHLRADAVTSMTFRYCATNHTHAHNNEWALKDQRGTQRGRASDRSVCGKRRNVSWNARTPRQMASRKYDTASGNDAMSERHADVDESDLLIAACILGRCVDGQPLRSRHSIALHKGGTRACCLWPVLHKRVRHRGTTACEAYSGALTSRMSVGELAPSTQPEHIS